VYQVIFSLSFDGGEATNHTIDLYDISHALLGFQRSLALTTHLVLNDEIITQAPALRNASIRAFPADRGSWEIMTGISIGTAALYYLGTAPKETPLGHLIYSAYDYLVKAALGVRVDYSKTLGQQYEELKTSDFNGPVLTQSRFDSLIEKCEPPLKELHRPITGNGTAERGKITARIAQRPSPVGVELTQSTFEYLDETFEEHTPTKYKGRVSSYNSNTFKGRVFVPSEGRPIAFELTQSARDSATLYIITSSLAANTLQPKDRHVGYFEFTAFKRTSRTGLLKAVAIVSIPSSRPE
jgi:hypothetical protein